MMPCAPTSSSNKTPYKIIGITDGGQPVPSKLLVLFHKTVAKMLLVAV
jgi:hypothetical protein